MAAHQLFTRMFEDNVVRIKLMTKIYISPRFFFIPESCWLLNVHFTAWPASQKLIRVFTVSVCQVSVRMQNHQLPGVTKTAGFKPVLMLSSSEIQSIHQSALIYKSHPQTFPKRFHIQTRNQEIHSKQA